MPRKRVLIFSLAYYPRFIGGAEISIREKTDRMQDIEFHMITLRFDSSLPRIEKIGNVLVHRIGFSRPNPSIADLKKFPLHLNKLWFQFAAAFKAFSLHRRYHYDAIWAMMAHASAVPSAIFKLINPRVPFILELQEGDPPEYIERTMAPLWPLFSRAFTSADAASVISTFLGRWAKHRGFRGEPILIPNAVDTKHFSQTYSDATINEIKDKLGKKMGDVFLITTSRLVHKNAVDDVIRALAALPQNVHFIILGTGPDESMLRELAKKLGVEKRVQFLGHAEHRDMPKYLKASDIFIRPSRSEGMGSSFVEAMAAGLPVIATQEGGIADFLFDKKRDPEREITGWAVDRDSPEQIAEAVKDIMSHPEKVRAVVATAREMVREKYDWDVVSRDMREKVFGPLLD